MGDDGLHKTDWMRDTFKNLQEDFAEAEAEDKRMVLLVEQRGCSYCREMHEVTFVDPRVESYIRDNYYVIQINLHGATEITDTDGEDLTERAATRKWGLMFTPTMMFLPTSLDENKSAAGQAVAVMPGSFSPATTLDLLTWVNEERYADQSEEDFQRYHARMTRERGGSELE